MNKIEAFARADALWHLELENQFGRRASDVRYTPIAHGAAGSKLRALYDARTEAREAFDAHWAIRHARVGA